ncbi:MAG: hypothetical protein EBX40_08100, partial [Gammaproteobacteria bacterium]|nr:hypothetical protein [Gammaproteobacteria bacterium]
REFVKAVNPELFEIIDAWNPPSDYKLYKMAYHYGDNVIQNGELQIPGQGQTAAPQQAKLLAQIKKDLSYSHVPLGLLIENGQEVFVEAEDRVISIAFFNPGVILGLWESLEPEVSFATRGVWNVSAGARSLYMLPKVAESGSFERLRKHYGIRLPMPRKMADHHHIFAQMSRHKNFDCAWQHQILFFSKKWIERDEKNSGWLRFHHHLLEKAWALSAYNRNMLALHWIWQQFSASLTEQGIKPNTYLMDTLKQLVAVGVGAVPGFRPAYLASPKFSLKDAEIAGPIAEIQRAYLEEYGLKIYVPTLMVPHHFNQKDDCKHIYYSLQVPTLLDSVPKARSQVSLMVELRELKDLVHAFIQDARSGKLSIAGTPVEWLVHKVKFDFFHSDVDQYGEIRKSADLPIEDPSFMRFYEKDLVRE